jgi:hypothetical protein
VARAQREENRRDDKRREETKRV